VNDTLQKLLSLQECDVKIRRAENEERDIPARKKGLEERLAGHKQAVKEAQSRLKSHQAEIANLELEIASKRESIAKMRNQQFELRTNAEYKTMDSEIEAVQVKIAGIEDRQIAMMDGAELLKKNIQAAESELNIEAAEVQKDEAQMDERLAQAQSVLEQLRKRREELVATVADRDWLTRYEQLFQRRDCAIAAIQNGICSGCQMKVPPQTAHDAVKDDRIVSCNYCGRLLYVGRSVAARLPVFQGGAWRKVRTPQGGMSPVARGSSSVREGDGKRHRKHTAPIGRLAFASEQG